VFVALLSEFRRIKFIREGTRKTTRMVESRAGLTYEERLCKLNVTTLEMRHLRCDLIAAFIILKAFEDTVKKIYTF